APAQNEVARIPISASEYFLVENRDRDFEDDGLTLTIYKDGQTFTQQIENGDEEFNSINIEGFEGGVVVDADDFDWALPGGIDADDKQLTGGILIWHIDERILADGLAENRVNVDVLQRGVDLEEADGAQDIGFPSDNIFGPQAFLGSPFDFFYENNPIVVINAAGEEVRLYNNRFGPATFPNSNSNADGLSFIVLEDFSAPGAAMSFNYRRSESTDIIPIDGFTDLTDLQIAPGSYLTSFPDAADGVIYQSAPGQIVVNPRDAAPSYITSHFVKSPVVLPDGRIVALAANPQREASLLIYENGETSRVLLDDKLVHHLPSYYNQLLFDNPGNRLVAHLDAPSGAQAFEIDLDPDNEFEISNLPGLFGFSIAVSNANVEADQGAVAELLPGSVLCQACDKEWFYSDNSSQDKNVGQLVFGEDESGQVGAFVIIADGFNASPNERLIFLQADESVVEINLTAFEPAGESYEVSRFPILLDVDRDGRLEVLITYGPNLFAFSAGGGLADGFPVTMPAAATTQPLVASMQGESEWTVIVGAEDGYIYGYTLGERIQQAAGFPLAVGARITATPLIRGNVLYAVDNEGAFKAWELVNLNSVWWGEQYANLFNSSFVKAEAVGEESGGSSGENALLVADENYNWPNPIRNGETHFRLFPSQDARVTITIIDVAGALIDTIEVENVRGETSTDILWQTDAASGLYFARVEAVAGDGTSETKLIRIAIVR
ncbi:MAG: T9SS type A sorting domain-containing protein, partial [Rhodothermales bacterium]